MSDNSFNYDFSVLSAGDIRREGGSLAEIISVCENTNTRWREAEGFARSMNYFIAIGYSSKKRIIQIACRFTEDSLQIQQMERPDEETINRYYCER